MKTTKNRGRIIGILFLLMFIPGSLALNMRGISSALMASPDFLQTIYENAFTMKLSVMLDLLAGIIGITIAITFFPVLREYARPIALWYFGLWIVQFGIAASSNLDQMSLVSLSEEFVASGATDVGIYNALGILKYHGWLWAHFLSLLIFAIGAALLYYALFKSKLVPKLLAVWGMLAVATVFTTTLLQIFDYKVSFMLYMQNGIHLIALSVWLIVKGFNVNKLEEVSA